MAQAVVEQPSSRPSPLESFVDRIWRFFCSVRAAVVEIIFLAVLVLIGTLRGSSVPNSIGNHLPVLQPVVDRWYAWDVFHSPLFASICALIAVAITVCTLNRVPGIWKSIHNPTVSTSQTFLRSTDTGAHYDSPETVEATATTLEGGLRSRGYRVLTENIDGAVHLYADKNRFGKFGTFPFHLALIMFMIAGVMTARMGFRDNDLIIPEASVRAVGNGTDLYVRLDQFSDSWRQEGTPSEYRSDITIMRDGEVVKTGSATVNHPVTYNNITFYQASFGQAVSLKVTDAAGNVLYDDSVPMGQFTAAMNPDAPAGIVELPQINAQLSVIAPDENRANQPELDKLNLQSGQMFVQLAYRDSVDGNPAGAVVTQGEPVALEGITVDFVRERRYTVLQVASNPGMPVFWAASFLLVGGLAFTFYFPHRRMRGIVSPHFNNGTSLVNLSPLARRDWSGKRDFIRTVQSLEKEMGITAQLRTADSDIQSLELQEA